MTLEFLQLLGRRDALFLNRRRLDHSEVITQLMRQGNNHWTVSEALLIAGFCCLSTCILRRRHRDNGRVGVRLTSITCHIKTQCVCVSSLCLTVKMWTGISRRELWWFNSSCSEWIDDKMWHIGWGVGCIRDGLASTEEVEVEEEEETSGITHPISDHEGGQILWPAN